MRDRKSKRERAREPEVGPDRPETPEERERNLAIMSIPLDVPDRLPPATWADVAIESARAARAAAEAASDIARTGHPEGVELVSQDEGLLRADTSRREVEWLRRRLQDADWTLHRAYDALAPMTGPIGQESARLLVERWLTEEVPEWHVGRGEPLLPLIPSIEGDELAFRPVEGPGQAFGLRGGDVLRVSLAGSPVFFAEIMSVAWRNEPTWEGVEVGLQHLPEVAEAQGHGLGYISVSQPPIDSLEHFQKMAKGQQKRAARLSEALAHMTSLHTKGKRAAVKMQKRISALQTALEEERMRADRAEGACERLGNARTAAVEEYRSTRAELDRLMTVDPVANAQAAIDAEREQKDRVARYLREMITQAIGQNEAALDGRGRLRLASETLQQALREAYDPDEIPF